MTTQATVEKRVAKRISKLGSSVWQGILKLCNWAVCGVRWTMGSKTNFFIVLAILLVLRETYQYPSMTVEPISVPSELAEMGYTPEVMARHLIDSIREYKVSVLIPMDTSLIVFGSIYRNPGPIMSTILEYKSSELDFNLPTTGWSIKRIAAYLNDLLRPIRPQITVSGELLYAKLDGDVSLRLRINKERVSDIHGKIDGKKMDKLFLDAVYQVIKKFDPSILTNREHRIRMNNLQGILNLNDGDVETAVNKFKKALERDPESALSALTYVNWGAALSMNGDYDGAIEQFRKAVELNPRSATAYQRWGVALGMTKDYDGAIEQFKKALERDPEPALSALTYVNWGVALGMTKDYDGAIEQFKNALERDPEPVLSALTYVNWGAALSMSGDHDGAIEQFKKAVELDPNSALERFALVCLAPL